MVSIERIPISEISIIRPLWEKLNQLHLEDSRYFKDHYRSFTFSKRIERLGQLDDALVLLEIVQENKDVLGYCLSLKKGTVGEIESLFVDDTLRGLGWGGRLVERAMAWFRNLGCGSTKVTVSDGHDSVLPFYEKYGFLPRAIVLEKKLQ